MLAIHLRTERQQHKGGQEGSPTGLRKGEFQPQEQEQQECKQGKRKKEVAHRHHDKGEQRTKPPRPQPHIEERKGKEPENLDMEARGEGVKHKEHHGKEGQEEEEPPAASLFGAKETTGKPEEHQAGQAHDEGLHHCPRPRPAIELHEERDEP